MQLFDIVHGKKYIKKDTDEEKTQWINIGAVFKKDDGKASGVIHSIPIDWDGTFIIRERTVKT